MSLLPLPLQTIAVILLLSCLLFPCAYAFSSNIHHQSITAVDGVTTNNHKQRVVIIGAGVGGLATAARISSQLSEDVEVIVLEKNSREYVGGRCGSFDIDVDGVGKFRHERGPSLLLLKDEYERLFADCSTRSTSDAATIAAQDYGLDITQCIPAYQVVFEDGDTVSLGFPRSKCTQGLTLDQIKDIQIMEQESIQKFNSFETNGFQKWQEYLNTCSAFLDCGLPNFIEERFDISSFPSFLVEALKDGAKRWPLQPHSTMLSKLFTSPKLLALASFQDLYVGLSPYMNSKQVGGGVLQKTAPAVFGLLAALELHPTNNKAGVFAPIGGFKQVAESMYELCCDNNVQFQFDCAVTKVTTNDGSIYISTATNEEDGEKKKKKEYIPADLVICNADVPFATATITRTDEDTESDHERYDWDDTFDYSSGVIAFHWSVSRSLDALNTHNVFMSANTTSDAENSWSVLSCDNDNNDIGSSTSFKNKPFNFYVHRAGRTDHTACPAGCDSIMVLLPCPTLKRNKELASMPKDEAIEAYREQFNDDVIIDARDAVLQRLSDLEGLENLNDLILHEVIDTPVDYANNYNVGAGVPFGLVSMHIT